MKIRNKTNGGYAEVDEGYAAVLVANSTWEIVGDEPAKPVRRPRKAAAKSAPKPEEASNEE